jgi:dihydrolipoamide dehydrogenase
LSHQLVPSLSAVPDRVILTDADYIGFEMGSIRSRLGAKATVIELLDRITPSMDSEVTK